MKQLQPVGCAAALTLAEFEKHIVCLTQKKQNLFKRKGPPKRRGGKA
jgi:hypothetical protein